MAQTEMNGHFGDESIGSGKGDSQPRRGGIDPQHDHAVLSTVVVNAIPVPAGVPNDTAGRREPSTGTRLI